MARLLILVALLIIALIVYQRLRNTPKQNKKALYIKLGLSSVAALLILAVVTGRMHWIGALIGGILPFIQRLVPTIVRLIPAIHFFRQHQNTSKQHTSSGNQSTVETSVLSMILDHDSGMLSGKVKTGAFKDRQLDDLTEEQLKELLRYCQQQDEDSLQLLSNYLQHRFGETFDQANSQTQQSTGGINTVEEALSILGLDQTATRDDIIRAHKTLMQKLHPDRGGNDYLAAQINAAKDFLLKHYSQ